MSPADGAPAPIIITALLGDADFAFLDALRRRHFPPERNLLSAHLTLFHHLPPSVAGELKARLVALTRGRAAPRAELSGVMKLGRGVAFRVASEELDAIRADLAEAFGGVLMPQDRGAGWRPHVTIQNKVTVAEATELHDALSTTFRPRPLKIGGLAAWWYRGGPWELLSRHPFSG